MERGRRLGLGPVGAAKRRSLDRFRATLVADSPLGCRRFAAAEESLEDELPADDEAEEACWCPKRPVVVRVCTKTGVIFGSPLAGERGDILSLFLAGVPPSVYHKEVHAVETPVCPFIQVGS